MAYMCVSSLFVLTLLQLCRAEISDSLPENWYSANVINDGFQPKSISEIFSTESPFSSTNPIIVLPKSSSVPDEIALLSTLPPSRKISTTGSTLVDFTKTTVLGLPSSTSLPPISSSTLQSISPSTYSTTPSTIETFSPSQTPQITQFTQQTPPPSQPVFSIQPEIQQTTLAVPQPIFNQQAAFGQSPPQPIFNQQTELGQSPPRSTSQSEQTQSQQIRLELVPQGQLIPVQNVPEQILSTQQQQSQSSTVGPLSNYFLIYQQAPQSIQGFPGESQQFTAAVQNPTTPSTVIIQPAPTVSPLSTRTAPPTSTTPVSSTIRVQTTPTARTTQVICQNNTNLPSTRRPPVAGSFPLRIRVVAPSGSITNVNINPTNKQTTTKRPTTKRPTTPRTKRTSKPKKNTYEACTDGCKGRREPICAAPLSSTFLDPNTLKGFPSVCHMACHNSYRKDPYEKVLDGRCGRLRTRIRTVDSNTKLKRDELNKAQYFLDNSGTKTIVEVSALQ